MDFLFAIDPHPAGSKGFVMVGDRMLVYRRDTNTNVHPLELDLPGGAPEPHETPFDTFKREVKEEFGLTISPEQITYARRYPGATVQGKNAYYIAVQLPAKVEKHITLGNEGTEFMLLPPHEFVSRNDAWPLMKERVADYLAWIGTGHSTSERRPV